MTEKTYRKAGEIKREIEKLQSIIGGLKYRKQATDRNINPYKDPWWYFRALNLKKATEKTEEAYIIIFDNTNPHGTEIEVDEDFLNMLINYFEGKKKEKEKEFDALS